MAEQTIRNAVFGETFRRGLFHENSSPFETFSLRADCARHVLLEFMVVDFAVGFGCSGALLHAWSTVVYFQLS